MYKIKIVALLVCSVFGSNMSGMLVRVLTKFDVARIVWHQENPVKRDDTVSETRNYYRRDAEHDRVWHLNRKIWCGTLQQIARDKKMASSEKLDDLVAAEQELNAVYESVKMQLWEKRCEDCKEITGGQLWDTSA